ncbi:MAG: twin-arginine translocation signal domain-containing protein, partial [Gemmatimonadetes bacterium]|nr:twin-arginine translocation signal domain-containing protein [Gemmatimonadota bacterium]
MNRREALQAIAAAGALSAAGPLTQAAWARTKRSATDTPVILECAINGSTT